MKPPLKLQALTVAEAQAKLERAVREHVNQAEWSNPYSGHFGRRYWARVNSLRIPLAELRLARKNEKH